MRIGIAVLGTFVKWFLIVSGTHKLFLILFGIRNMLKKCSWYRPDHTWYQEHFCRYKESPYWRSLFLSRGKILVSTWNEEAARHTHKEGKYFHFWRAEPSILERSPPAQTMTMEAATCSPRGPRVSLVKQILSIIIFLSNPRLASHLLTHPPAHSKESHP